MNKLRSASILVISLWLLLIFSVYALGLYRAVSSKIDLTKRIKNRSLAQQTADNVLALAVNKKDANLSYDCFFDLIPLETGNLNGLQYTYWLSDEGSKLNLNNASVTQLLRLPQVSLEIAQTIKAYGHYFVNEELSLVKDLSPQVYQQLKNYLTAYGVSRNNVNTVSPEVLAALGFPQYFIDKIVQQRAGDDGLEGTLDDQLNAFNSLAEVKMLVENGPDKIITLGLCDQWLDVKSEVLTLHLEIKVSDQVLQRYAIIFDKKTKKIYQWLQN